jgi:DNA-binding MarR family transcriptional regulator
MTVLASKSGIAMSTATGAVDHLVEQGLVVRDSDPQDRRLVICRLSAQGEKLANDLWKLGRLQVERLLDPLTLEQLQAVKAGITDVMKLLGGASGVENENG